MITGTEQRGQPEPPRDTIFDKQILEIQLERVELMIKAKETEKDLLDVDIKDMELNKLYIKNKLGEIK